MITTELDTISSSAANLSATTPNALGKDDFLNLLVTQLQNQDPLNPTDSAEFTAQLAQFSSLEQLGNVNENLVELQNFEASINNSQAVSMIGKTITAAGKSIHLNDHDQAECKFILDQDAARVQTSIYDSTGKLVKKIESQNLNAGTQTLFWDGKDEKDQRLAPGNYTFEIMARDAKGQLLDAKTFSNGTVDKVIYENNATFLISGNQKIALGDVIEVAASQ